MRKIVQLTAENVKRLTAVEINPDGNVVIVGGKNGAGKSSVLDAIEYALGGKGRLPGRPIRDGTDQATIEVHLDGQPPLHVKRTIKANGGGQLSVTSVDGMKAQSPQTLLNDLCGAISFDPLEFVRMEPKKQVETLRELAGMDFSKLDEGAADAFADRTLLNRSAATLKVKLDNIIRSEEHGTEEVSVAGLMQELSRRRKVNEDNERARVAMVASGESVEEHHKAVRDLERLLADARDKLDVALAKDEQTTRICEGLKDEDLAEVEEKIGQAEEINSEVRANQEYVKMSKEFEALSQQKDQATKRLDEIKEEKARLLKDAKWPIDGLGFTATGVSYNGLPFEQASSSEQLRVSVAIGGALKPEVRVLLVRDGSLLDEDSLAMMIDLANEMEMQVWLERVGTEGPCSVVIEDGHVREEVPA